MQLCSFHPLVLGSSSTSSALSHLFTLKKPFRPSTGSVRPLPVPHLHLDGLSQSHLPRVPIYYAWECSTSLLEAALWSPFAVLGLEAPSPFLRVPYATMALLHCMSWEVGLSSHFCLSKPWCLENKFERAGREIRLWCCIPELLYLWRISRNIVSTLNFNSGFSYGIYLHTLLWFSEIYAPTHLQYMSNFHMYKRQICI